MDNSGTNDRIYVRATRRELSRTTTTVVSIPSRTPRDPSTSSEERSSNEREHRWFAREEQGERRTRTSHPTTTASQEERARRFEEERARLDRQSDLERQERPGRPNASQTRVDTPTQRRLLRILHLLHETQEVDPSNREGLELRSRLLRVFGLAIIAAKKEVGEEASPGVVWSCLVVNLVTSQLVESEGDVSALWRTLFDLRQNDHRFFNRIVEGSIAHTEQEVERRILSEAGH